MTVHVETPRRISGARRTIAMIALLLGALMDMLDGSVVNIALPTIQHDLGADKTAIAWIVLGYTLAFAVLLLTSGRLGDRYGYRRVFVSGTVAFALASLACGLAPNIFVLCAFRFVQGAAAAVMMPQITSMLQTMYRPEERSRVLGLLGAVGGIAAALGPLAGAGILSAHLLDDAWRPIFLLNLPIGAIGVVAALRLVPRTPRQSRARIDVVGAVLSAAGFGLLILGLVEGVDNGWPAWTWGALIASAAILAAFVVHQLAGHQDGAHPDRGRLVPARLFSRRSFSVGLALSIIVEAIMGGLLLVFTLTLQDGLALSPIQAGLATLPLTAGMVLGVAVLAEMLLPRIGRWVIALGGLALGTGIVLLATITGSRGADTSVWDLLAGLAIAGVGLGMIMGPLFAVTLAEVRASDAGAASGTLEAAEQLGTTLGVATIGSLFITTIPHGLAPAFVSAAALAVALTIALVALVTILPRTIRSEDKLRHDWKDAESGLER